MTKNLIRGIAKHWMSSIGIQRRCKTKRIVEVQSFLTQVGDPIWQEFESRFDTDLMSWDQKSSLDNKSYIK